MTAVIGLMSFDNTTRTSGFPVAMNIGVIGTDVDLAAEQRSDSVFQIDADIDPNRWEGIVIHDLGRPAGDPDSIHRFHQSLGYHGLGYHFVIGNGNGLQDGAIHVGYRWNEQLAGAHVAGEHGSYHNQHSIGICLVGNGDRRPFTPNQTFQLLALVRSLCATLDIPPQNVHLHRDLEPSLSSPGRFFDSAEFREQLLD